MSHAVAAGPRAGALRAAPRAHSRLVMLEHDGPAGPLGSLQAALGFSAAAPDAALKAELDRAVAADPGGLGKTAFAVLDLTTPGAARYAGHRATIPFYPASIGKVAIMFAAFQLRHDLMALARREGITDFDALADRAATYWAAAQQPDPAVPKTVLRASKPELAAHEQLVLIDGKPARIYHHDRVRLERIFDKAAGIAPLRFRSDGLGFHQLYYIEYPGERRDLDAKLGRPVVPTTDVSKLGFADRLALTVGFSNNYGPRALVADLGFALVTSPLLRSGLFDPEHGGLWLGNAYEKGKTFRGAPVGAGATTATALSLVTLMAALFREVVFDAAACAEARRLLHKGPGIAVGVDFDADPAAWAGADAGAGTTSFVLQALRGMPGAGALKVHSKLGIYKGTCDVAHVEHRLASGRTLRYAVAILDVPDGQHARLGAAARAVDEAVRAVN